MVKKISLKEYEEFNLNSVYDACHIISQTLQEYGFYITAMEELTTGLAMKRSHIVFSFDIFSAADNTYCMSFDIDKNKIDITAVYKEQFVVSNYGISIQPKEIENLSKAIADLRKYLLGYIKSIL